MSTNEPYPTQPDGQSAGRRKSRALKIGISAVVIVAVGVGAFFIASSLSGSSSPSPAVAQSPVGKTPTSPQNRVRPSGVTGPGRGAFAGLGRPVASGTVSSVGSDSFVLKEASGSTATVQVSSKTVYSGTGVTDLGSLKAGDRVAVFGTGSGSAITATRVIEIPAGAVPGGGFGNFASRGVFGTIKSIGSSSFTISTRQGGTDTVDVTAATKFTGSSGSLSGLSALKKGDLVIVSGTTSGTTVKATAVTEFTPGSGGFGGGGFGGGGFGGGGFGGPAGNSGAAG